VSPGGTIDAVLPPTSAYDDRGRLTIGGCVVADVVREFGTSAMLVDEAGLRATGRRYLDALRARRANVDVHFASKSLSVPAVCGLLADEGLGCDVAAAGELAVALAGGVPAEHILLHGNAKRDLDLQAALDAGIGLIVIDSFDEIDRLERLTAGRNVPQHVLIRVNPDVFAATHEAMATGHSGSKFGLPADQVPEAVLLDGLHAHIGSQILDLEPFAASVERIAAFGDFPVYDLGGGLGVRYTPDEPPAPTVEAFATALMDAVDRHLPADARVIVEPGRSIVAPCVVTAYTVVTVKRGGTTFVAVDGGMGDNLETALYGQRFAPLVLDAPADRPDEVVDLVGHHCETGDRLVAGATLPRPAVGDVVLVPVTGAYCHSMSNNYNGYLRPPIVLLRDGDARAVVRRETLDDLLRRAL
jgi:diaminopimelate decarboxylase